LRSSSKEKLANQQSKNLLNLLQKKRWNPKRKNRETTVEEATVVLPKKKPLAKIPAPKTATKRERQNDGGGVIY
jgi:hypothetical protein